MISGLGIDVKKKTWWELKNFDLLNDKFIQRLAVSNMSVDSQHGNVEDMTMNTLMVIKRVNRMK